MKIIIIFTTFCLIGVLRAATLRKDDVEKIVVQKSLFETSLVKYAAEHDIVEILVPLNALNFKNSNNSDSKNYPNEEYIRDITIFFVEADIQNIKRVDRGLYVFKNEKAKNILPTGRTAAASAIENDLVFFGASDGLFSYEPNSNSAVKYGPITDGIISIATEENGKTIYIVTDDHKLYRVSNNGETKDLVDDVEDAQEIVLDDSNNIYYYNSNKEVFIRTIDGVIQVKDLPPNPKSLQLVRPPFTIEDGVPLLYDSSLFFVYSNGTSEATNLEFSPDAIPTAYEPKAVLVQFYAFDRKLYQYNFVKLEKTPLFQDAKVKSKTTTNTTATKN